MMADELLVTASLGGAGELSDESALALLDPGFEPGLDAEPVPAKWLGRFGEKGEEDREEENEEDEDFLTDDDEEEGDFVFEEEEEEEEVDEELWEDLGEDEDEELEEDWDWDEEEEEEEGKE